MNYTKLYLEGLISGEIEESSQLEYKAANALKKEDGKKKEVTKDVSAFANAAGGTIIYGIAEERDGNSAARPTGIDPVDSKIISKEWLDQVISGIQPKIADLRIHAIQAGAKKNEVCYVIEIPQSDTAHQAKDGRYYKRRNFESTMMEDYEIRDVMNRRKHPKIDVKMRYLDSKFRNEICIGFRVHNTSRVIAKNFLISVRFPAYFNGSFCTFPDKTMRQEGGKYLWLLNMTNGLGRPLFPNSIMNLEQKIAFEPGFPISKEDSIDSISLCIFADEMERIELEKDPAKVFLEWT